jgi:uncharacterized membrane protein
MDFGSLTDTSTQIALLLTAPWVLFALLGTFSDVLVGYIDEWLLRRLNPRRQATVNAPGRLLLLSGFFGGAVALGACAVSIFFPTLTIFASRESLILAVLAGVLEVVWMIPYFHAMERGSALQTTPLFQTIPIFSLIFGIAFFGEVPLTMHIAAACIVITGAAILNYEPRAQRFDVTTLALMLVASATISAGFFFFKDAALGGNFLAAVFGNGLGMFGASFLVWLLWPPYRRQFVEFIRSVDRTIIGAEVTNESLYAVSALAGQYALVIGPSVMSVAALNAFHPIFTLLVGGILALLGSREHARRLRGTRAYAIVLGVLCIALGTTLFALA